MAFADTEREQIERIKWLWNKFGNLILALLLIASLSYAGWTFYSKHKMNQIYAASSMYDSLLLQQQNPKQLINTGNEILKQYPSTVYANFAAFILASQYVNQDNLVAAKTSLQWVISNAENPLLIVIAQNRIAIILISEGKPEQAIKLLSNVSKKSIFSPFVNAIRGQAYAKMGDNKLALQYWNSALDNMNAPEDAGLKQYLELKINSLAISQEPNENPPTKINTTS